MLMAYEFPVLPPQTVQSPREVYVDVSRDAYVQWSLYVCISLQSQENRSLRCASFAFPERGCMIICELSEYADLMNTLMCFLEKV